jgi:phospho-N-acetylmuramoyl-pentapeptide-transferase
MQGGWFEFTRIRFGEGRRILLCAPAHHHFQQAGWKETQVVGRFYLIAITLAIVALVSLKLR